LSFIVVARLTLREHLATYATASLANILLVIPVSQFSDRAGLSTNLILTVGLHQLLIGVLVFFLIVSGSIPKTWRWQYIATGLLVAGYVAVRLSNRFFAGLEIINSLALQGASVTGMIPTLYSYGLGAAGMFTGMVLAMRKAYGRIVSARSIGFSSTERST
jgi:hypothetical protein